MQKKLRKMLIILLSLVLAGSLGMCIRQLMTYRRGREIYEQAVQVAQSETADAPKITEAIEATPAVAEPETPAPPADPIAEELAQKDLLALKEVNEDVLGWILLPETSLSYPVVQGTDNEYYLNHTWDKTASSVGSIFLECQNSPDMEGFSTIIYGHRMRDGSMFGILREYKNQEFWAEHPYVYLLTEKGVGRYDIYAAYEADVQGTTYRLRFDMEEDRQEYIDYGLEHSVIDTGVIPETESNLITLSTCTGNGYSHRWVVQAVLAEQYPIG